MIAAVKCGHECSFPRCFVLHQDTESNRLLQGQVEIKPELRRGRAESTLWATKARARYSSPFASTIMMGMLVRPRLAAAIAVCWPSITQSCPFVLAHTGGFTWSQSKFSAILRISLIDRA